VPSLYGHYRAKRAFQNGDGRQLAAIATPAPEEATGTPDQIIDTVMARSIYVDAMQTHPLAG
jgi:hypothetical protein